jgi:predicted amidohydrolase YtcJ
MRVPVLRSIVALAALAVCAGAGSAQDADFLLVNGKIVTVDDRFSIAEALAVRGERIAAVGTRAEVEKRKGPLTRIVDLGGRTVIPGLIDNHAHYMRAAEYWHQEVRLDGVESRKAALDMIRDKAKESKPGEWVLVLGGWSEEQFTDDKRAFTKAELDAAAPDNPVLMQLIYFRIFLNSRGLEKLGIGPATPDMAGGKIGKDAAGQPTGVLDGAGAVRTALTSLGEIATEKATENARLLMKDLNRLGITAYQEMGGRSFGFHHIEPFKILSDRREMTVRLFYNLWLEPTSPAEVDKVVEHIGQMKPFQGDDYFDLTGYGETVYFPLHDNLLAATAKPSPEGMQQWKRVAQAVADRGMHMNIHAQLRGSIEAFLTALEEINRVKPIKGLRWAFSHADQLERRDIERMKRLGMYVQLHSRPTIQGGLMMKVHGDRTLSMPPLRMVRDSGLPFGLGSDATAVAPINPFYTLGWAVTGEMLGGAKVLEQTISREDALIAHTRGNAPFLFQEANIGSLTTGRYADLLVLDRDYLTVPGGEIKTLKPLMTMVGGRIVHQTPGL